MEGQKHLKSADFDLFSELSSLPSILANVNVSLKVWDGNKLKDNPFLKKTSPRTSKTVKNIKSYGQLKFLLPKKSLSRRESIVGAYLVGELFENSKYFDVV